MKKLTVLLLLTLLCFSQISTGKNRKRHRTRHKITRVHKKHSISSTAIHSVVSDYAAQYEVPAEIIFAILYYETGYRGKDHKSYNGARVSRCGAVGPMQIMPRYAKKFAGRRVSRSELRTDYSLNISVGVKMLAFQYKLYGSWLKVLGAYSTGKPKPNKYGRKVLRKASELKEEFIVANASC